MGDRVKNSKKKSKFKKKIAYKVVNVLGKYLMKMFIISSIEGYKKCLKKMLYCIGEEDTYDLPELNFISKCSEKKW